VPEPAPLDRRSVPVRVIPVLAFFVAGWIGNYTGFTWARDHPELLLLVDARNRHLALAVGAGISPLAFFLIGFVRLVAPDPFSYLLGRDYGDQGVTWIERQTQGQTGYLGWVKKWFARAADPLLVLMPNFYVCLFAGIDRIPGRRVAVLDAVGTAGRLVLFWVLANQFRSQLEDVLDFVEDNQWWLIAAAVVVAMIQSSRSARAAAKGEPPPPPPPTGSAGGV
jgi:membrane protein DedA with SNARE-associated domain